MCDLRIIIVNYKTPQLTIDCLQSLVDEVQGRDNCQVTVVENASPDDSAQRIGRAIAAEGWDGWVELAPLDKNLGFAGGNNAALRTILAEPETPAYVLLLNPDTVVCPGAIQALVDFMEQNRKVGIAGSRLEAPDGSVHESAFRFHTIASELDEGLRLGIVSRMLNRWQVAPPARDHTHRTDWVAGASMIIRRGVFNSIGLMDDDYFLYYEEVDFCLRARRAGWTCWYVPTSRVIHLEGQSSGVTDPTRRPKRRPRYWFDSRRRYFTKNHGRLYALAANLVFTSGFALWRLRRILQRRPDGDPPHMLWDSVRFNFFSRLKV